MGHETDNIRTAVRSLHELYDGHQFKSARIRELDDAAMRLTLCSSDEEMFLRFWQTVREWGWSQLCCPTIPRPFAGLLAQYDRDDMEGKTLLQSLAEHYGTRLASSMNDRYESPDMIADLKELIGAAISAGFDVHQGDDGHTPLQLMLSCFAINWDNVTMVPSTKIQAKALLTWLEVLQRADVDLSAYGQEEERIRRCYQPIWSWPSALDDIYRAYNGQISPAEPTPESIRFQFTYGPTPADWNVTLLDFVEECSRDFWGMVEAQNEHALYQKYVLPGGWIDT
jgi:hypothetical protein